VLLKILLFAGLVLMLLVGVSYLSRARHQQSSRPRSKNSPNLMDSQQARGVLGMEDGPITAEAVIAAHRRLMQRVHPDKGGSQVLAQQLNEAKRVLLQELS
jgi:hypothetical protein